jgi:hypothetical protein
MGLRRKRKSSSKKPQPSTEAGVESLPPKRKKPVKRRANRAHRARTTTAARRTILDAQNYEPADQLPIEDICDRVVALAQVITEKQFYPYQVVLAHRIVEAMLLHEGDTITALISRQSGKGLAKGTEVLLYDGSIKRVEDIEVGDKLLGDDNTPRNVLSLARGRETMYEVKPRLKNSESYTVNASHILSVVDRKGNYRDIAVKDYLKLPEWKRKDEYRGYKVGLKGSYMKPLLDPYWFGLWLGDGRTAGTDITTIDREVVDHIDSYAKELGLKMVQYETDSLRPSCSLTR